MELVDSHCHLDFPELSGEIETVIARSLAAGVTRMVTISTFVSRVPIYRALAEEHAEVFFSVGTHPHNAAAEPDASVETLLALADHPRCVAIGEAGLDYFYDKSPRDVQQRVFRTHIAAARASGLPLVIHARDADADMIDILQEEHAAGPFGAILHCFSSGPALAEVGLALGFCLSFSGILTFKRSEELRAIAAGVPLGQLLVETDAPYLAPDPHRGKRNEPAYTALTAAVLAKVKGVSLDVLAAETTANAERMFGRMAQARRAA
jgi:TatD DNase family protein